MNWQSSYLNWEFDSLTNLDDKFLETGSISLLFLYSYGIYTLVGLWLLYTIILRHNFKNPTYHYVPNGLIISHSSILPKIHFKWPMPYFTLRAVFCIRYSILTGWFNTLMPVPCLPRACGLRIYSARPRDHSLLSRRPRPISPLSPQLCLASALQPPLTSQTYSDTVDITSQPSGWRWESS